MADMPEPIRVFHLIKSLGRGGAETLLPETLRFADRSRFEYRYGYFLPWKDAMVASIQRQGAEVTCFGGNNNAAILAAAHHVARHLQDRRTNLLHCHLPVAGVVGRLAGRIAGVPVVYTEHNKQERYHRATRYLNHLTWDWQMRVIAVSGDVAASIRSHVRSEVPVQVILNGVDVERFARMPDSGMDVRRQLGIPPGAPVIGSVAVFRVQKRLEDWLDAAQRVRERCPDAHFLLVGDGPLREEIATGIAARGLEQAVHLPGLQEDVRPYLSAMDVYLMSSTFEGLPIALLEAMSMECAPVCTSVGGIPEVLRSGENGLLVPPRHPELLAASVMSLLLDPDRRRALAGDARRTIAEQFSMRRMVGELEGAYREILEQHRNGH